MSVKFVNKVADDLMFAKESINEESSCCRKALPVGQFNGARNGVPQTNNSHALTSESW